MTSATRNHPRFSFITPVYNTPEVVLRECVDSVLNQWYSDWELCLVDDGSTAEHIPSLLAELASIDPRIRVSTREQNGGIVAASNDAVAMAQGDFIVLLDHDDVIELDTLHEIESALASDDEVDLVYSDSDKLAPTGERVHQFSKPDWSPERFRHQNYLIHIASVRRSIVEEVGGFRPGFDGSQDYDLLLRASERCRHIFHIKRVLYHWRMIPGSTAGDSQAKPEAYDAGRRAIADHCLRVGIDASVEALQDQPGSYRVRRRRRSTPLVSIVMPTAATHRRVRGIDTDLALNAIESIQNQTSYPDVELVVAFDQRCDDDFRTSLRRGWQGSFASIEQLDVFNFADAVNRAVDTASGDVIVLLNDDVEVITGDWLDDFVALLEDPTVGSVGPKLLLPDNSIQSAGHWHGATLEHLGRRYDRSHPGPFSALQVARECSSLTGACLALRRDTWELVGGMTTELPNAYNDADFGNKLSSIGLRNVWLPWVQLYHYEISTRDPTATHEEIETFTRRWPNAYRRDKYTDLY